MAGRPSFAAAASSSVKHRTMDGRSRYSMLTPVSSGSVPAISL